LVVRAGPRSESAPAERTLTASAARWHELECGGYRADLPLWLELSARARGRILDVGAGTGRVARVLARAGYGVTALDIDPSLLAALDADRRAGIETACADARGFSLARRDFGLCLVPMHTIQLLRTEDRDAFYRTARAHLRAGGVLACAVLADAEPFDCREHPHLAPSESITVNGLTYVSRAVRVEVCEHEIVIERQRSITPAARPAHHAHDASAPPFLEHDIVTLVRVSAAQIEAETAAAGFLAAGTREVPASEEHLGSVVVVARA
jgi:SAM-dependent methyltransferase